MKAKLFALAALAALTVTGSSFAGSPPVVAQPLALGKMAAVAIQGQTGNAILTRITMPPGSTFGWHEHGAPVAVIVKSGTLTVLDPAIGACKPFTVGAGASFVEPANHVHLARNDGKKTVVVYALYLGVGAGTAANRAVSAPTGCTG